MQLKSRFLMASAFALCTVPAAAVTMFGSLSNFDIINDTGRVAEGFEIELPGLSSTADILYTFSAPYIRYAAPRTFLGGSGVIVQWSAAWTGSQWSAADGSAGTPMRNLTTPTFTLGHQCYTGGDPINYPTSGCEHFGIAVNVPYGSAAPTPIYRWLWGDANGNLSVATSGAPVQVPAPAVVVLPPPAPAAPPQVQAVVAPPPPEPQDLFGPAQWVKVFVTEVDHPLELNHLVIDDPQGHVPVGADPAEVEIEWQLMQANKLDPLDSGALDVGAGKEAVSRRYEYYKYTGDLSLEGEALCENPKDPACGPQNLEDKTLYGVGDFIGAQNAAVNLDALQAPVPEPETWALMVVGIGAVLRCAGRRWPRQGRA
jgi:hypothetical protein